MPAVENGVHSIENGMICDAAVAGSGGERKVQNARQKEETGSMKEKETVKPREKNSGLNNSANNKHIGKKKDSLVLVDHNHDNDNNSHDNKQTQLLDNESNKRAINSQPQLVVATTVEITQNPVIGLDVIGEGAGGDVAKKESAINHVSVSVSKQSPPSNTTSTNNSKKNRSKNPRNSQNQVTSRGGGDVLRTNEIGINNKNSTDFNCVEETKRTLHDKSKEQPLYQAKSQKKMKKGIFVSYSPDGNFTERRFVSVTVKQFKENNLPEDIWFDKDEQNTDSPFWFSQRMEAIEKCRAAICFLSKSYLQCPVSVYELRSLLERHKSFTSMQLKVFVIRYDDVQLPKQYKDIVTQTVDLTEPDLLKLSLYERASTAIGSLYKHVESCASINAPYVPPTLERDLTRQYTTKKLCRWSCNDVQSWLNDLGIREFYCQCFLENSVDGFLLISIVDQDMVECIGIDSRVTRKKILQQIVSILEKEHKMPENWHLRSRTLRRSPDNVYLSYDPADVQLSQNLKLALKKKNLQVTSHKKLGQSKDEFLQINGPQIASAKHVVIVMTETTCQSPFVFHEVLFADWLGKTLLTAMFKNSWDKLRPSLKAVLGECPAIDFETRMFPESMDILQHHIKPLRKVPGVVLEQSYLNRMTEGIKTLQIMASAPAWSSDTALAESRVFISYQWDVHNKVKEIKHILESNHIPCWADNSPTITHTQHAQRRGYSSASSRSTVTSIESETMQGNIQRNMKSAPLVLCCMTPRYLQSDNCIKDLLLAGALQKPIVPVLLRFIPWPPDTGPSQVKKLLACTSHIDLSNDKLFKQNFHILIDKIRRLMNGKPLGQPLRQQNNANENTKSF